MVRPIGNKKISKKGLSPLARGIVESLEEYAAYKRGEKTGVKIYTRPRIPEDVDDETTRGQAPEFQLQALASGE